MTTAASENDVSTRAAVLAAKVALLEVMAAIYRRAGESCRSAQSVQAMGAAYGVFAIRDAIYEELGATNKLLNGGRETDAETQPGKEEA